MYKIKYFSLIFIFSSFLKFAQELDCTVTVNYESLPVSNRELLTDFGAAVEDYMNKTRFSNDNWDAEKIICSMNIFFTSASSDVDYSAQVVVTSQRPIYKTDRNSLMLTVNDGKWSFKYEKGQAFYANQSTFEPITSFLDYYAKIILGLDWDSFESLAGSPFFAEALNICNLGANSQKSEGWVRSSSTYSRMGLAEDLLNEKYRQFRESIYDYHLGIDYFSINKKIGQDKIVKLINTLESLRTKIDLNSVVIKTFFDAKSGEIIEYLSDYPDKSVFTTLKKIDPPHMSKYEEAMGE